MESRHNPGFDAVIFDLDGVISKTAELHSRAWKQMFDAFLNEVAEETGSPQNAFTHVHDYLAYVDGKPRYEGVKAFLSSRGIVRPFGDPLDKPGQDSICALGNWKNQLFNQLIDDGLLELYPATMDLIYKLREFGIRIGVASSSKNTRRVLSSTDIEHLFDACVDGISSLEWDLCGKPAPDIFLKTAEILDVSPYRSVVVEDALVGVQAARDGNFGLVLGVARKDNAAALLAEGADLVVHDLSEMDVEQIVRWFEEGLPAAQWSIHFRGYDPEREGMREALLAVGNGYCGTRGAMEEAAPDGPNYPGTYVAGVYNTLQSEIAGRSIENEDMVNLPNWLATSIRIENEKWLDVNSCDVETLDRKLNMRSGELTRTLEWKDASGKRTRVTSRRVASMKSPHLLALQYLVEPLNYSGHITIRTGLEGRVANRGVPRYWQLASQHLVPQSQAAEKNRLQLEMITSQSGVRVALAGRVEAYQGGEHIPEALQCDCCTGAAYVYGTFDVAENEVIQIEKVVTLFTSRESEEPLAAALDLLGGAGDYDEISAASRLAWRKQWDHWDVGIEGDRHTQTLIRFGLYHLLLALSPNSIPLDAGIPARGLTGESYRGHVFWDELFILPVHNLHDPDVVRAALMYRYRRLDKARENAGAHGYKGAMYPWQSGSDGSEQTQIVHLNPLTGDWGPDYSSLQRHVSLAIAYTIWRFVSRHNDIAFLEEVGAEMFFEICRLWASMVVEDADSGRYDISGVMGPDEYHEACPGAESGGVRNNAYTNLMVQWALKQAREVYALLSPLAKKQLEKTIQFSPAEIDTWDVIWKRLNVPVSAGSILEQYEGFHALEEVDWDEMREKYGNIQRLDRILKAEGTSPDDYQVVKQADALMVFYNLTEEEVLELLRESGHVCQEGLMARTFDYYFKRTSHGSTLSPIVHASLAQQLGRDEEAEHLFHQSLVSDFGDVQGGTTAEGVHLGVMAGCVMMCVRDYGGLDLRGEILSLSPDLPAGWSKLAFHVKHRGESFTFIIAPSMIRIRLNDSDRLSSEVMLFGERVVTKKHEWTTWSSTS